MTEKRYDLIQRKWTGPLCCVAGIAMLAVQAYVYANAALLSAWLIGAGIGLVVVGAIMTLHDVDDRRSRAPQSDHAEFPSADEFDNRFEDESP
jgi:hypothetical protein